MRKVFKAITEQVCEKKFLNDWDDVPKGWHYTTAAALAAYKPRGRPKAETEETVEDVAT